ncbi:MAG: SprB repeat-containing protein [Chitinophagaceae bacterium]
MNIPIKIPHLKSSSDYIVTSVPYLPYAYVTAGASEEGRLYNDDAYSTAFSLPFPFCFYDSLYEKAVIGSNGVVTFDEIHGTGSCENAYTITPAIPAAGAGAACSAAGVYYPRAAIMGCYTDLDPRPGPSDNTQASPPDRKIEWRVEGSAPCRRFVISYFHVGSYGNVSCSRSTPATFQIVMYESTGIIEVFLENKRCQTSSSAGRAILGIQNWYRDKAVAAPGKNATVWTASNEGYRFTPSGGVSRFKSCQVFDINGNYIATGDTITTTQGMLDVTFPAFCPPGSGDKYIIKTTFTACQSSGDLESSDTITINRSLDLNATATTTQTTCGAGTGTATVTVPAGIGTAPYTFVLNPGSITQTSASGSTVFNGLTGGNYTVAVSDAGGCSSNVPVTITSTGTLSVNITPTNTSCVGAADGVITVTPPSGTPPIVYSINGGAFGASNVFSGLAPATYYISVKDNGGCQASFVPVTIAAGPSISMTTSATPSSCPGANNGTITITGATGTPPYEYSINGAPYQTSNVFTGLAPATYFISLKDAKGCTVSFTPVTITQGTATVSGTVSATPVSCSGATDGSITATPTSGSGPYEYSINSGTNWQASNLFSGLAAGSYSVIIREAGICQSSPLPVTVAVGPALTGTVSSVPTACPGVNNGSITVTPTNGSAPYQYSLDGGAFQAGSTFTGVAAGPHSVVIKSGAGCTSAGIPVTVTTGTGLTASVSGGNTSCSGAIDGTITVTPTNGSAPYQYSLDGGAFQSAATFTGVGAGPHSIKFRDDLGCISADFPVTVTAGPVLSGTASFTPTACNGVNNGTITATAATGFAGPFEYALNSGTYQSSTTFTGLAAGNYTVKIRNAAGCVSADIAVNVTAGAAVTGTIATTNTSCSGAADGNITVTPVNGSAPYQYALDGGAFQSGATFTGLGAGPHTIVVRDNFGCLSTAINASVTAGPVLTGTATSTPTACAGVSNGIITVTPDAGFTGPFEYALDGGTYQAAATFTGVASGPHAVKIRNTGGCVSADIPVTVTAGSALDATLFWVNASCSGAADATLTVRANNGAPPYQYSLDGGAYQSSNIFNGIAAGPHTVKFKDNFGCISTDLPFTVIPGPVLTGTATFTATACAGVSNGTITVTPTTGFTGPFEYALNSGTYQSANTFTGLAAGNYTVKIRNAAGCVSADIAVNVTAGAAVSGTIAATNMNIAIPIWAAK